MLNNVLKLNFRQKINLFLRTRGLSRREKSYSINFFSEYQCSSVCLKSENQLDEYSFWNCPLVFGIVV